MGLNPSEGFHRPAPLSLPEPPRKIIRHLRAWFKAVPADHSRDILKTRNILNLIGSKRLGHGPRKAVPEGELSA
jgi:hypothetical protein